MVRYSVLVILFCAYVFGFCERTQAYLSQSRNGSISQLLLALFLALSTAFVSL